MKKNKLSSSKSYRTRKGAFFEFVVSGFYKVIPKVLVFAFIITSLNINGMINLFAKEITVKESEYAIVDYSEVENEEEVTELRSSNSKVFKKQNDAYELEIFSEDVHYQENGKFLEINNDLLSETDYFTNTANKFKVNINKDLSKYSKIKINNHSLEWKFNNVLNEKVKVNKSKGNEVEYQNIFNESTSLEYMVLNDRIKENIILSKYINNFNFSYTLKTDLQVERIDNTIFLYDDLDKVIYTINEYFMYDKNDVLSYEIDFTITQSDNNEYIINVSPSDNYLKNATYPVVIDPEIGISLENIMGSIETKYFDSSSSYYPYECPQSPTYYPKLTNSTKLLMQINFPTSVGGFNLNTLKYSNFLYAYVSMPTTGTAGSYPRSYSSTPTSRVIARSIDTNLNWGTINGYSQYSKTSLSEQEFSSGSVFTHRFDIFDYFRNNIYKFGTSFNLKLEFTLSGGAGSFVKYNHSNLNGDYTIPSVKIGYSDDAGLKDYFTYEEIPTSNNSVSYIAHNSGNLISVYNDYSTGNLLNIAHIFNSNRSNVSSAFGKGYRLNYQESITSSGLVLYLTKGDGSQITFVKESSSNYYIAQDGSGDKITKFAYSYELITKADSKKLYNSSGNLYKIIPNIYKETDFISITYLGGKIDEIIDSFGNKIKLLYNSDGFLNGMFVYRKDANSNNVLVQVNWYTYDYLSRLTRIERDDRRPTESKQINNTIYENYEDIDFNYDDNDRLIYIKDNITNGVRFLFDKANRIDKVTQVIENIQEEDSPYLDFSYDTKGRRLTITDANNLKNTYTFDKEFHTKSITNSKGYTSFYEYYDIFYYNGIEEDNPNYYLRHKIKNASQPYYSSYNLINNHSFELSNSLIYWKDDLNKGIANVITSSLYGSKVLKLETRNINDIAKVYQTIKLEPGEYILSGYINNENGGSGIIDVIGNNITIINRSDSVSNGNYNYYYVKFSVTSSSTIDIVLKNGSVGISYLDMIQLNSSIIDNRYNYLQNSSFEHGNVGWTNLASLESTSSTNFFTQDIFGNNYANVGSNGIEQTVLVSGSKGDSFVFGGFAYNSNINFKGKIILKFNYLDNKYGINTISFDSNDLNLQYMLYKAVANEDYKSITFTVVWEKVGSLNSINEQLKVDNLVLYKEGYGLALTFNEKGDIEKSFNEVTKDTTDVTYHENGDVDTITKNNVQSDIKAENNSNLVKEITTNNISTNYQRDEKGNVTGYTISSTSESGSVIYFTSSTQYSPDKQYIINETNDNSWKTSFNIDYLTGLSTSVYDNNMEASYKYDLLQNNTEYSVYDKIEGNRRTITYSYEGRRLTKITIHGNNDLTTTDDLSYSFVYNAYGDIEKINVAGNTLVTNTYNNLGEKEYKGQVSKTTYGEFTFGYSYDNQGRIIKVRKITVNQFGVESSTTLVEYVYDALGNIAKVVDYKEDENGISYYFNYDIENRIVNIKSSNGNHVSYGYDSDGLLSNYENIGWNVNYDYTPIIDFADDSEISKNFNQVLTTENFNAFKKEYTYVDKALEKLKSSSIIIGSTSVLSNSYVYETKTVNSQNFENFRIKELVIKGSSDTNPLYKLVYGYNEYDNITSIIYYKNGIKIKEENFKYDTFYQLIEYKINENSVWKVTNYTYDDRGNIASIIGNGSNITFIYESTGWLDQLKSVNIDGVTKYINNYDSSGNPRNYLGYTVTYDESRRITSLNNGILFSYKYNASGYRISQSRSGILQSSYTLDGSKIIKEFRHDLNKEIMYYYDSSDNIIGLSYLGENYFYVKNLQNDIIGIVNSNGDLVVEYKYSPYGLTTLTSDKSGISLGTINPFRFKSYHYDNWTGFYYCNSRYYNPELGRWINADDINYLDPSSISRSNLFAYCGNNPINNSDSNGHMFLIFGSILLTKIAIAVVATATAAYVVDVTLPMVSDAIDYVIDEFSDSDNIIPKVSEGTKDAAATIDTVHSKQHKDGYNVYLLVDNLGDTFYVGITKDLHTRDLYHQRTKTTPHKMFVVARNVSLAQARILETSLIIKYGTLVPRGAEGNHMYSVNKTRVDFDILMGKVESDALLILGK